MCPTDGGVREPAAMKAEGLSEHRCWASAEAQPVAMEREMLCS